MRDKSLTEAEWKKFSKGRNLKDAALLKALTELDKARVPAACLEALEELEKQAGLLGKANKADKEVTRYLDDLDKALRKERALAEGEAKKAAQETSESEGEEDAPDILTAKLVPLMRLVRQGEVLQAMVALGGKNDAVLISRKSIGPSRHRLLTDYLGVSGGVKFITGECLWEANAYTFAVKSQASGLAKKLREALLKQTEQRYKIRVRGEGPGDIDDDGEPAEEGLQATGGHEKPRSTAVDPEAEIYARRFAALEPAFLAALKDGARDVSKLRAVMQFASSKSEAAQYRAALQALDALEKLLATPPPDGKTPQTSSGGDGAFVRLQGARVNWDRTRKQVQADLDELARVIRTVVSSHNEDETAETEYEEGDLEEGVKQLYNILTALDTRLIDALDAALKVEGEQRKQLQGQAGKIVAEYRGFINTSPLMNAIDGNPFMRCAIRHNVDATLTAVAAAL